MKPPFEWDEFSDQPRVILDKRFKRNARLRHIADYLKMLVTAAVIFPIAATRMGRTLYRSEDKKLVYNRVGRNPIDFFGMGVSLKHGRNQLELINELGVRHVLLRVPLWDVQRLANYRNLASEFQSAGVHVLINVLQDREHIEDLSLLRKDLTSIFDALSDICLEYQIGNAINRVKWGFFSVKEYIDFFLTAQTLRDTNFRHLELLGPSVIDFEYHYTIRALFNGSPIHFDHLSALLYVDRMGSPYNRQFGIFDTDRKIRLLASLAKMSSRVKSKDLYITEANWPLASTAPWAPTSEKECVSIDDYCQYLTSYHEIAWKTKVVSRVYWHQLVAPGYGLIDNRSGNFNKTPAYETYRKMLSNYQSF